MALCSKIKVKLPEKGIIIKKREKCPYVYHFEGIPTRKKRSIGKFDGHSTYLKTTRYIIILCFYPLSVLLIYLSKKYPEVIEYYYARMIYPYIIAFLSTLSNFVSISIAECLVIGIVIGVLLRGLMHIRHPKKLCKWLFHTFCGGAILYFLFVVLWGLNYYRLPLNQQMNLDITGFSVEQLQETCEELSVAAQDIRKGLLEDSYNVMLSEYNLAYRLKSASEGFAQLNYDFIFRMPSRGKPIFFSKFFSLSGISGIYFPFTAEANINRDIPDFLIPVTICHEQAHQLGFAREDEANFLAFLACIQHPDLEFQYSGIMLAFMHVSNALYRVDPLTYHMIMDNLEKDSGVYRDLMANQAFWSAHDGKISEVGNKINDTYLRSNGQSDGVNSYGRMVDLLLAYYQTHVRNSYWG